MWNDRREVMAMRAVVMAGGEGTRLRPLTSNQPKPMVPLCNKPCMEYIVELLRRHRIDDVVVTLAFLPKLIRSYFDDGSGLGVHITYSIEEAPMGTAGSVKLAEESLDDTFLVISGDALTDFDLSALVRDHKKKGALVTIALKRVPNPLEFGVVVIDDDGHILRFLEKPTWGQVFSDLANTGVYVLEPEIFDHMPQGQPYDFSQDLFPKLLAMGAPLYGCVADGYWQDIGSLPQYLAANRDLLDGKVKADLTGLRLENDIWLGDDVSLDTLESVRGPVFLGDHTRVDRDARLLPYTVLGNNVVVGGFSELGNCVVDANTYIGSTAVLRGAIVGKNVEIKAGVTLSEGSAIGDECRLGEQAFVGPDVKVYPFKTVDAGAQVDSSIIWESRGTAQLFGKDGIAGLANVDVTPELGLKVAMAYGTTLRKGSTVMTSRDADPISRIIKRAMISGLNASGINVRDLRVASPALARHEIKTGRAQGAVHVRLSSWDPETVQIQVFEPPGIPIRESTQKGIEKHFGREGFRRAFLAEVGQIDFPDRAAETYLRGVRNACDMDRIAERAYRLVIDYGGSAASTLLPDLLGPLDVEALSLNMTSGTRHRGAYDVAENLAAVRRLVTVMNAHLGVVFDPAAELVYLVDDQGDDVPLEKALLLYVRLVGEAVAVGRPGPVADGSGADADAGGPGAGKSGARRRPRGRRPGKVRIALPVTVTGQAELLADEYGLLVERTKVSPPALTEAAGTSGVVFAGGNAGGYIFPEFVCAFDAVMSLMKLLELLAPHDEPLSDLVAGLPTSTLVHRTVACPWSLKGTVMRTLTEELQKAAPDDVGLIDGVRVTDPGGWVQILPDADEPVFHVYAEGVAASDSTDMAERFVDRVRGIIERGGS
jgi:mannose-1-phosphate guanylyltransferase/phosphomannomutase